MQVTIDRCIRRVYKNKNKEKIRFIVVVYGLLWLRFYMEIKIRDEIG